MPKFKTNAGRMTDSPWSRKLSRGWAFLFAWFSPVQSVRYRSLCFALSFLATWFSSASVDAQRLPLDDLKDFPVKRQAIGVVCVEGRLLLRIGQFGAQVVSGGSSDGWRAKLAMRFAPKGEVVVDYTLTKERRTIRYLVTNHREFEIVDTGDAEAESGASELEFRQPLHGPLTIKLQEKGKEEQHLQFVDLWQFALLEPRLAEERMWPLLHQLQSVNLKPFAETLRGKLFDLAEQLAEQKTDLWDGLVRQLGSSKYSERKLAERELMEAGPSVVLYLRSLDPNTLDAEQRERVDGIEQRLAPRYGDEMMVVALNYVNDKRVWVALASEESASPHDRTTALRALARLMPAGMQPPAEGDAPALREYLSQIRQSLEPLSKPTPGKSDDL